MMNKKSLAMLVLSFAAFSASVFSLASAAAYTPPAQASPSAPVFSAPSVSSGQDFEPKIIRLYQGSVAVFSENSDIPEEILSSDISSLPPDAIARLKQGIYAYSYEEYLNYLEDFSMSNG